MKAGRWERTTLRRARACRQDARSARLRTHRTAGRPPGARARHAAWSRSIRSSHAIASASSASSGQRRRQAVLSEADFVSLHLPLTDETRGAFDADALGDVSRRQFASSTPREASSSTKLRCLVRSIREARRRRARRVHERAVQRPIARAGQRHRHAASGGIDRRGSGPGGADRGGASRGGARRRPRHERRERAVRPPGGPRGARPVRSAGGEARPAGDGAGRRPSRPHRVVVPRPSRRIRHPAADAGALNGAFQGRTDQPVNAVNAPLVAAERGISVEEEKLRESPDYTSLVRVAVQPTETSRRRRHDDRRR